MLLTNRIIIISFYIILLITLLFGLWPLNLWPRNEVHWLKGQSGVEMHKDGISGKYSPVGIMYTNDSFKIPTETEIDTPSFSIELYIQSKSEPRHDLGLIVSFNGLELRKSLMLSQWKKYLILRTPNIQSNNWDDYIEVSLSDALPRDSTRFITITSGSEGTSFYLNGEIKKYFHDVFLVSDKKSVSGKMVVGNSSSGREPWAGKIFAIGIYEDELKPEIIKQHYQFRRSNDMTDLMLKENCVAFYRFDEGQGNHVENLVGDDKQLIIPERFTNLDKNLLESPWIKFSFDKSFIFDFIVNLLGFIPLGVVLVLYLRKIFGIRGKKLFIITIILGGMISLTIELLQVLMPQRYSSLLDLVLNISGLCVGICMVRLVFMLKRQIYAH